MFSERIQNTINTLSDMGIKQANGEIEELERQIKSVLKQASKLREGGGLQRMKIQRAENLQKEIDRIKSAR